MRSRGGERREGCRCQEVNGGVIEERAGRGLADLTCTLGRAEEHPVDVRPLPHDDTFPWGDG